MNRRLRIYAGIATTVLIVALGLSAATRASVAAGGSRRSKLSDAADATGPLDVRAASLDQAGRRLQLTVRTRGSWTPAQLNPLPSFTDPSSQFLCFALAGAGSSETRLCLGGSTGQVGLLEVAANGTVGSAQIVGAGMAQPRPDKAVVSLPPGETGLMPGRYRWRALSQWSGPECATAPAPNPCADNAPDSGTAFFRLRPVGVVGCTRHGPQLDFHGPRTHKAVALTFDDGPSDYTARVLHVLRQEHAKGTFFEIGEQVAGRQKVMRSILASGDEIANHTTQHSAFPGYADLVDTNRLIKRATGFTPCLFRPPGGAFDSGTLAAARKAQLKTIIWDVDPRDWSLPGSTAILSRVVGAAHPGAIVVMHDGGGNRGETVAALPQIISELRHDGYSFDTVSRLLGDRMIFGPIG